jgi:hypothetical protein
MSIRIAQNQQCGQAAVEALLIIIFGFMLVLAIHHLGQLRSETLDLLGESHFLSFLPEKKLHITYDLGVLSAEAQRFGVQHSSAAASTHARFAKGYAAVRMNDSPYSAQQREIENQLGFDSSTLLRATARSGQSQRSRLPTMGLFEQTPLVRHSYLLSGFGQADSTQAAQQHIAGSAALWQKNFARSKQLVSASATILQNIDRPWGRPVVTDDWLLPWANEVVAARPLGQPSALKHSQIVPKFVNFLYK